MTGQSKSKTILTGVKPTGAPHIGNYVGAIRPALRMAEAYERSYLFIADYHALNAVRDKAVLQIYTQQVAATWLACGLDPEKTVFYRQSDVPEIFELATMLTALTPKGLMDRAHAYKAAADKNKEEGRDPDADINMGLYTYPILMAADIIAMNADFVPVGRDQIQHIEFARDMAGYFNNAFGSTLKLPEAKIESEGDVILGLDGRKMSKSYNNTIPLFAGEAASFITSKAREKLIMKIVTDSKRPEEPKKPDENVIYRLYTHFATPEEVMNMRDAFLKGGMGYGDAKKLLAEAVERQLEKPLAVYQQYMSGPRKLNEVLDAGAAKARTVARATLSRAREAAGLRGLT